jgi:glucose-1-phosphate thymidylyltransferase
MKGIILAGGSGSRLYPLTKYVSKQLLPIYDKPMIYYPLSTLMLGGIRDILIISDSQNLESYKKLLGTGKQFGIRLEYCVQEHPNGIAEAFILGKDFIQGDSVALILGDNIFHGQNLQQLISQSISLVDLGKSVVIGHKVPDPERYGVAVMDDNNQVIAIQEKPKNPKSDIAIVGLYFYTNNVVKIAEDLTPSDRGELEITDVNNVYIEEKNMEVNIMGEGFTWLDTGTFDSLHKASTFVKLLQDSSNYRLGLIDEVAFVNNFINKKQLEKNLLNLSHDFKDYIKKKYL